MATIKVNVGDTLIVQGSAFVVTKFEARFNQVPTLEVVSPITLLVEKKST